MSGPAAVSSFGAREAVIVASELWRTFGARQALRGVSFSAGPGEILGLLGENGAGKTTLLRILAGVLAPDSGRVTVEGQDLAVAPPIARARIGYLPEGAPAYPEMRVREYLDFRGALRGVPSHERSRRVTDAATEAGLDGELDQVIGRLSRGFRQRVGLADAILHRPALILLDEPTDGLDPNQRVAFLDSVRRIGSDRTVVFSSHILAEVESVCSRVIVLASGRAVADEAVRRPGPPGQTLRIEARGDAGEIERALLGVPGVVRLSLAREGDLLRFTVEANGDNGDAAARAVIAAGGELRSLTPIADALSVRFAALTRTPVGDGP